MSKRDEGIADLLMGAAHADEQLDDREVQKVKELLRESMNRGVLPGALGRRIDEFDPKGLDLGATVKGLGLEDRAEKRRVLDLIAAVHDADQVWDFSEDDYLREVAGALGLVPEDYADLTVQELSIDFIGEVVKPPPLPKKT